MFNKIKKSFGLLQPKKETTDRINTSKEKIAISEDLETNLNNLKNNLAQSVDLNLKNILLGGNQNYKATVTYLVSIINQQYLQREILKPLMLNIKFTSPADTKENIKKLVQQLPLPVGQTSFINSLNEAIAEILEGKVVLFINNFDQAFVLDIKEPASRSVATPQSESATRGPHRAFIEN